MSTPTSPFTSDLVPSPEPPHNTQSRSEFQLIGDWTVTIDAIMGYPIDSAEASDITVKLGGDAATSLLGPKLSVILTMADYSILGAVLTAVENLTDLRPDAKIVGVEIITVEESDRRARIHSS